MAASELDYAIAAGASVESARAALDVATAELDRVLLATNEELDAALASCSAAVREMHHRVGNIAGVRLSSWHEMDLPAVPPVTPRNRQPRSATL